MMRLRAPMKNGLLGLSNENAVMNFAALLLKKMGYALLLVGSAEKVLNLLGGTRIDQHQGL